MSKTSSKQPEEPHLLPRHLALPVLILALMTVPWFFGGREPMGLLVNSLLSLVLFASWLIVSRYQSLKVSIYPRAILWSLVALLAWSAVVLPLSISRYTSILYLIPFLQSVVVFVVARDVVGDKSARRFIWMLWTMVALVVLAIGAVIFVTGDYDRMTSLFYWANPLATYFIVALLASIQLMEEHNTEQQQRKLWLIAAGLFGGGLILTYSRAAWLIVLVVLVLMAYSRKDKKALLTTLAKVAVIAAVTAAVLVTVRVAFFRTPTINVSQRVAESTTSTSVTDRFAYWRESTAIFSARPLTGWGIGTFKEIHATYQEGPTTAGDNPHSTIFQAFAELGVVGAGIFLLFIGALARYAYQMLRDPKVETWRKTAMLAVIAIGLHSFLDLVSNYPVLILTLALFLAMALPITEHVHQMRIKSWRLGVPLIAFGLLLTGSAVYTYYNYLSAVDTEFASLQAGLDPDDAAARYVDVFTRPVYDPNYLSDAALLQVSRYLTEESAPVSLLEDGERYARLGISREPYDEKHHFALAQILENQGKTTEALKEYQRTLELDPYNYPPYQAAYAKLLRREGYVDEAIEVLLPVERAYTDEVIANRAPFGLKSQVAAAEVLLTDLYIERGKLDNAAYSFGRVKALVPQDDPVVNLLQTKLDAAKK
ncbi:O-antigen ligase family protein [bacterium]|nr:O-antigen ligase family protein [bacterium]